VSEKLTRQELQQWLIKGGDTGWMIGDMWARIEADREAVREEVRAEVTAELKNQLSLRYGWDLEDLLECLFWEFDSEHKKSGMERDVFKSKMRFYAGKYAERVREELLKDHFKIGEYVDIEDFGFPFVRCRVLAKDVLKRDSWYGDNTPGTLPAGMVRRSAKKRPMTDAELLATFKASEKSAQYVANKLKPETIHDILQAHGISTETDQP
jgi:hypothetical protein